MCRLQPACSRRCGPGSAEIAVYLDSSALVKLVVREAESDALAQHLADHPERVSCALARVEVVRAVHPHGAPALTRARKLLERVGLLRLDDDLLDAAGALAGSTLRSLDAIHLAAAHTVGPELAELITYDRRMADAAVMLGLSVAAPTPRADP
ncbi:MAG TPA: type II toxin-antitoxin system VapC family toxin [Solirubrobacteraceae bacterium]|jgi:predicted nucleic acid-binding protein|nr:type II toxin-antitoxin system VapC family toxin [Solirubrobacteraceae bacterium]